MGGGSPQNIKRPPARQGSRPCYPPPVRGDRYGTHRVLQPAGALPQAAWRLDNDTARVFDDEVVIDVETLNVDSASFRQMEEEAGRRGRPAAEGVAELIRETVAERGKQH